MATETHSLDQVKQKPVAAQHGERRLPYVVDNAEKGGLLSEKTNAEPER